MPDNCQDRKEYQSPLAEVLDALLSDAVMQDSGDFDGTVDPAPWGD